MHGAAHQPVCAQGHMNRLRLSHNCQWSLFDRECGFRTELSVHSRHRTVCPVSQSYLKIK